jgi:hypothetical protein
MHPQIRAKAQAAGYSEADGTLLVLGCGAEDTATILSAIAPAKADTIVSVLTLCTVPAPQKTLRTLVEDVLAPGGTLLFHEHILSPYADVAWWQHFWTPVWSKVFDGCCLNRPTHFWIKDLADESGESIWADGILNPPDLEEERLFPRQSGRFVKK